MELYEALAQSVPKIRLVYGALGYAYMHKGLYNKAKEILEYYLNNISDNARIHRWVGRNYLCEGKYALALVEADKAFYLDPTFYVNFWIKGDIYHCKGDLIAAEKEYQNLLNLEEKEAHIDGWKRLAYLDFSKGRFEKSKYHLGEGLQLAAQFGENSWMSSIHTDLAYLYLRSGKPEKALEECNQASSSAVKGENLRLQRIALHLKGFAYLGMKSMDKAQKTANELKALTEEGLNRKAVRFFHHLKGMIELEKGNFSKAIDLFKETESLISHQSHDLNREEHALFFNSLAQAYYKSGNMEKAKAEYERIISLTTGRLRYGDIYAKSFYMLGKIFEKQGKKIKAIENYQKFLDLWKDADPAIPEVEDTRKRQAELK